MKSGTDAGSGKQPDVLKCITHFDGKCDISVYFALFEGKIARMHIVKNCVMHLLNLPSLEILNIIKKTSDTLANNYDHVKELLLKCVKITPKEFRQKLMAHKKRKKNSDSWRELTFKLRNYLEEGINGIDVSDLELLTELIVADQTKRSLPVLMKEHFTDDFPKGKMLIYW